MLTRSELIEVRPFRTGLVVLAFGIFTVLGDHGGYVGDALTKVFGGLLGGTGQALLGITALVAGALLVSGASAGAVVRRSGRVVRRAGTAARRSLEPSSDPVVAPVVQMKPVTPPVDAASAFPDVVGREPPKLLVEPEPETVDEPSQESLFEMTKARAEYTLPDRSVLRRSGTPAGHSAESSEQVAEALVSALGHFGVEASVTGQISGPRVTRYELKLAPGTKMSKVSALKDDLSYALATTEIRILAPIPGKQAVGVEVPNLSPNLVTLGDVFDDLPQTASPLAAWLGKDISGNAVWTGPRADAAHPHRRHHRLGQVGLHQHASHLDPSAHDARRRAADPDRPQADRTLVLRVDSASPDAGRLEPEGGVLGADRTSSARWTAATSGSRPCARGTFRRQTAPSVRPAMKSSRTSSS